jgi:RimJ/RimL family protein N-acetyltransferase
VIELEPLDVRHVARLRELHQQPGVTQWWGPMEPMFPFDEPESTRYAILVDGEIAGLVQHGEQEWPVERHAYVDIFVGDDYAGRGIGTEALRRTIALLTGELGYRRILIDPSSENERAIRSYERAGFRRVGTFARAADSHAPGDELYMELVVSDS